MAYKLLEVPFFLTPDGFGSIPRKMAVGSFERIKADSVSRKKPSRHLSKNNRSCSKWEMGMIRDEHPPVTSRFYLRDGSRKTFHEILPVLFRYKHLLGLDKPDHDVVQDARSFKVAKSRHALLLRHHRFFYRLICLPASPSPHNFR
jgi:hypothetical protein